MTPLLAQRPRADRSFERLYKRHSGDVYRYALAVLRNQADAEDVTQTTFMNAYRAFSRGERPEAPKNWLIAIAHNVCRQRFRQAARRPSEVEFNEDVAEALVVEEAIGAEDIQRALEHLAFNQRAALVMRELEGRSYAEIAGVLGLTVAAVETLIFRARRALREQLEGSLTCDAAELAISKQADGQLSRAEKGQLRAHLRECDTCATLARSLRAQRSGWKALAAIPLPGSLSGLFAGSGGSAATGLGLAGGGALAIKAATAVGVIAIVGGTAYEGNKLIADKHPHDGAAARAAEARPATPPEQSARGFAPGTIKAPGEPATRPTVPPGIAKKASPTFPAANAPGQNRPNHHPPAAAGPQARPAEDATEPAKQPGKGNDSDKGPGKAPGKDPEKKPGNAPGNANPAVPPAAAGPAAAPRPQPQHPVVADESDKKTKKVKPEATTEDSAEAEPPSSHPPDARGPAKKAPEETAPATAPAEPVADAPTPGNSDSANGVGNDSASGAGNADGNAGGNGNGNK